MSEFYEFSRVLAAVFIYSRDSIPNDPRIGTGIHNGALPASGSFFEVFPVTFTVSAVKASEDGLGWILRGVNLSDEPAQVSIKPWKNFKKVMRVNLAGQKIRSLKTGTDGKVTFEARGHEIGTILFKS